MSKKKLNRKENFEKDASRCQISNSSIYFFYKIIIINVNQKLKKKKKMQ